MGNIQVAKFGGSSLANAANIERCIQLVQQENFQIVVLSAMQGITDLLLEAAQIASTNPDFDIEKAAASFHSQHSRAVDKLLQSEAGREELQVLIDEATQEFAAICRSLCVLQEKTTAALDLTVSRGERLIGRLVAAVLNQMGTPATYVDATQLIFLKRQAGQAVPDLLRSEKAIQHHLGSLLEAGQVIVVPGFIGSDEHGRLVTLGRGGTDLSATLLAHGVHAREVTLFKEVDGILTADPRHCPEARVVPALHYREAAELAYYGAKVLHPRTIIPLLEKKIPLRIRNTFEANTPGTTIGPDVGPGAFPVKALSAMTGQALVTVEGKGMLGVPGVAAKTFEALGRSGISVSVISQASSEASICFVVPGEEAQKARQSLEEAFELELQSGLLDPIRVTPHVAIIAAVGLGMSGTPGIAARTFQALAEAGVNVLAIAQGSSELNISFALREEHVSAALNGLHREFRLEKLKVLPQGQGRSLQFGIFGFGQIGRTLTKQYLAQHNYLREKIGYDFQCVGLADSSGLIVHSSGFSPELLESYRKGKQNGHPLRIHQAGRQNLEQLRAQLRQHLFSLPLQRGVFIDLTAEETAPLVREALTEGFHVVLANKKPLAVPWEEYQALFALAASKELGLRYEATVGAGLPILDTLSKLADAGDEVFSIEGCLSGTLGFLVTEMQDGTPFSAAVRKAYNLGYTEPDPREDLSGMDVARKALILARTLGLPVELKEIQVERLYSSQVDTDDPQLFLERLEALDEEWAERIAQAAAAKCVLRYVARIEPDQVSVSIEQLPRDSSLGGLRGTGNQVSIKTRRYSQNPLVVTGPGAGAEVTAAGVFNDVVALAATGRR